MEHPKLNQASDEMKLAVDIICLLESNNIRSDIALKALEIVKRDLEKKTSPPLSPR